MWDCVYNNSFVKKLIIASFWLISLSNCVTLFFKKVNTNLDLSISSSWRIGKSSKFWTDCMLVCPVN